MTRDIVLGIEVYAEPKAVYDTVATRSGLASFWTPEVEGEEHEGGELTFGFAQAPARLPVQVTTLNAPQGIEWSVPAGWPAWEGTAITWSFDASEHGTKVTFRHTGFADEMPDYDFGSIALTWATVASRLKDVVESGGAPNPALG
ncbi:MAG: SRPBCC domain-containing protein [Actinomycetota bacterium]|nr:SRPBCC domain-containing protein [Actinomycetota bacterium]MDH5223798.1 SRPBCC domain-containing protein [Actinomycetota bacterium]MDH5313095.1 SRPBCC domain-containing protein [Actinomycetota bacterium]